MSKSFYKVQCIAGTSRNPIPGGALPYWKRMTGNIFAGQCCVSGCCAPATDGAHVILHNSGSRKQYIAPMCHAHNMTEHTPLYVYTELVPVNPS